MNLRFTRRSPERAALRAQVAAARLRPPGRPARTHDPQGVKRDIIAVATGEFARSGYSGARVDEIAARTRTSKRMIYYYFGSKEALFVAVIEEIYRRFNEAESKLALDLSQPVQALRDIVAFIWAYYQKHPEFITLLNSENLHRGVHVARALPAGEHASPALAVLDRVLASGASGGVFRPGLRARDIYLMIAAMGYFYLSNRFTLSVFLGEDLAAPAALAHWQQFITDAVLRTVSTT